MSEPNAKKQRTKKQILFNAFEAYTIGHSNPGQWAHPKDRSIEKVQSLDIWEYNAKLLERGKFLSYFIADTFGSSEVYTGSRDPAIEIGTYFPILDPFQLVVAMAKATKTLGFGITSSTSFEPPFLLARRFSTLDHLTNGRIGWNIVTSWNDSQAKAVGQARITAHDERYAIADEYLDVLYKLWESSVSDDVWVREGDKLFDPSKVKRIKHEGKYFQIDTPFVVHPSKQRVPFLFQAGTSKAGIEFSAKHAEGIFVASLSAKVLKPKIQQLRLKAKEQGRDPKDLKIFALLTPIIGETEEDAQAKFEEIKKYRSLKGGLVFFSALTGIDLSKYDLDEEINAKDSKVPGVVQSAIDNLFSERKGKKWTPRTVGEEISIGGNGAVIVGSVKKVADYIEQFVEESDVDGFNISPVVNPGSYEDIVDLLIPELQRRGIYWNDYANPEGSLRSQIYDEDRLGPTHVGHSYRFE